jgi:hypothetical protein
MGSRSAFERANEHISPPNMEEIQYIPRSRWREELTNCWGKVKMFVLTAETDKPGIFEHDKLTVLGFWDKLPADPHDAGYFIFGYGPDPRKAPSINNNLDTPIRTFDAAAVLIELWWQDIQKGEDPPTS